MFDITRYQPHTKVFVTYTRQQLSEALKKAGKSCIVMTGRNSAKACGALALAEGVLHDLGIYYHIFNRIEPNPLIQTVRDCIACGKEMGAEFVFAVGAGSVFDASKAVAFGIRGADLFTVEATVTPLQIIGLLIASGTGSETTPYCRVTDPALQTKMGIANKTYIAQCFIDPEHQKTLPARQARSMFLDVLCHCCESAVCVKASDTSLQASFEGIHHLRLAKNAPFMSTEYFIHMARASVAGGCAINLAPCVLPHEMSYRITIKYDVPHGVTVAMIECSYLRFVARQRPDEVKKIYEAFSDNQEQFEKEVTDMAREFAVSIAEEDFEWIAKYMVDTGKTGLHNGAVTQADIVAMFHDCELLK